MMIRWATHHEETEIEGTGADGCSHRFGAKGECQAAGGNGVLPRPSRSSLLMALPKSGASTHRWQVLRRAAPARSRDCSTRHPGGRTSTFYVGDRSVNDRFEENFTAGIFTEELADVSGSQFANPYADMPITDTQGSLAAAITNAEASFLARFSIGDDGPVCVANKFLQKTVHRCGPVSSASSKAAAAA